MIEKNAAKEENPLKLTMLGTGHATVTECYNTCFVLSENNQYFLVDGGGGNTLLRQLKYAGIHWRDIKTIFVTHRHLDHIMGILWMLRLICQSMLRGNYDGSVTIYAHKELTELLYDMAGKLLKKKEISYIGKRIYLVPLTDGEEHSVLGHRVLFFDIHSTKAKQYGFTMYLSEEEKLTCCGDEPFNESEQKYARDSKWLLHEAFCLHSQADQFRPYEKHHSTALDACRTAEQLHVKNLILYHTEDTNIARRRELYTAEGKQVFSGNLYVPDDLEEIEL